MYVLKQVKIQRTCFTTLNIGKFIRVQFSFTVNQVDENNPAKRKIKE